MSHRADQYTASAATVGVVALFAVVAAAAGRPFAGGSAAADRAAASSVAIPLFVLLGLGVPVGFALLVAGRPRRPTDDDEQRAPPDLGPAPLLVRLAILAMPVLLIALVVALAAATASNRDQPQPVGPAGPPGIAPDARRGTSVGDHAVIALGGGLAAGAILVAGAVLLERRGRHGRPDEPRSLPAAVPEAVDDALAALDAEPDPRRAIIAAYLRMERVLAVAGLGRRPPEAPREYVGRVDRGLGAAGREARHLTALYEEARFSRHPIGEHARSDAVAAVTGLQAALDRSGP